MRGKFLAAGLLAVAAGCGKNEPGTMGGEPATPKTVATGAPAQAAKESVVSNPKQSARDSEHAMSTFDDSTRTNSPGQPLPQASTLATNQVSGRR
jgi:hypothetical protein